MTNIIHCRLKRYYDINTIKWGRRKTIKRIVKFHGVTVLEFVRSIINGKLDDMYDIELTEKV